MNEGIQRELGYYAQCELCKGPLTQTTWIPGIYALEGHVVDIKTNEGWDPGWLVNRIYAFMWSIDAEQHADGYKWHRSLTDAYRGHDSMWVMPTTQRPYNW